jgi:hypothetical protein
MTDAITLARDLLLPAFIGIYATVCVVVTAYALANLFIDRRSRNHGRPAAPAAAE